MPDRMEGIYVGGQWLRSASGRTFPVRSPATGALVAEVGDAGPEEARQAIASAAEAFESWSALPAKERSLFLLRARDLMVAQQESLARTLTEEQGKPLREARTEILYAADFVGWSAEEAKRIYGETIPGGTPGKRHLVIKQPVGVVAAITPWNFPCAMITRKIAPALAAGCTVVVKPAEQTPLSAVRLFQIFHEAAVPPGVANLVTAQNPEPVAQVFLDDPRVRKIAFTGSTEVGRKLMRGAAEQVKKLTLELGGHAPFLIFEDADLDKAVSGLLASKFRNAGQTCICPNRAFVHESVFSRFTEIFCEKVRALKLGSGLEEGADVGPLIDEQAMRKVEEQVRDAVSSGARVLCGGERVQIQGLRGANFYAPTVLVGVTPAMRVMQEETFGPVIPLVPFSEEGQALQMANDSSYGLAAYVYTRDLSRAFRIMEKLEYGIIGVNDAAPAVPQAPFGGMKHSGIGREGGRYGLEEFLEIKHISLTL